MNKTTVKAKAKLVKIGKVMEMTGLSEWAIRHAADTGELRHVRIGKHRRFYLEDVEKWLESRTIQAKETPCES